MSDTTADIPARVAVLEEIARSTRDVLARGLVIAGIHFTLH